MFIDALGAVYAEKKAQNWTTQYCIQLPRAPKTEETDGPAVISSKKPLAWKKRPRVSQRNPPQLKAKHIANYANKKNICKLKKRQNIVRFPGEFLKGP